MVSQSSILSRCCFVMLASLAVSSLRVTQQFKLEQYSQAQLLRRRTTSAYPYYVDNSSTDVSSSSKPIESATESFSEDVPAHQNMPILEQKDRNIMFVHVGKTGGTTLRSTFRSFCQWYNDEDAREECFQQLGSKNDESLISSLTKSHLHTRLRKNNRYWVEHSTSFFFTVRNPIDRAISAFNMDHSKNKVSDDPRIRSMRENFYSTCFPTINDLARTLSGAEVSRTNADEKFVKWAGDCSKVGRDVLQGNGHENINSHLSMNYHHYYKLTAEKHPNKEILVARTEHLWEDLKGLDQALGGTGNFQHEGIRHTHGSESYTIRGSDLDEQSTHALCCALHKENQYYQDLLTRAANLDQESKDQTMQVLYQQCGIVERGNDFTWSKWASESCGEMLSA